MRMAATAAVYSRLHNSSVGVGNGGGPGSGSSMGGHHHQLARSLERILEEAHFSGELILTNRKLKDFPKTSTKYILTDTVIADLSRNRFCELPEEITTFSFLETLLLYHNTIRSIAESIKHLTSLTYLDLRSNQLSSLPRELCSLPLQVLLVSNNRLVSLPDELGRMDRLTDLDVSFNQLTSLPARIGELHSLRSFSLRSNQLTYLPRELTCLTLISLDISNNRISSLPLEIRQMTTLVELKLENNPLTSPPASLCIRGLVHVFKYLETQAAKDEKGSRVGGNYDGYTTLRRTPRYNGNGHMLETVRLPRYQADSGYSTSDGIDKRWSHDMPLKTKHEMALRLPSAMAPPKSLSLSLNTDSMDASLTSSTSTIVDESSKLHDKDNCVLHKASKLQLPLKDKTVEHKEPLSKDFNFTGALGQCRSSSSNESSSPDFDFKDSLEVGLCKLDDKDRNFESIQTYREYKEALKQQRSQEVYRIKEHKCSNDSNSQTVKPVTPNNQTLTHDIEMCSVNNNGSLNEQTALIVPKSIMKASANIPTNASSISGISSNEDSGAAVTPKKPVQKVIPSRHTEITTKMGSNVEVLSSQKLCAIIPNCGINGIGNVDRMNDCASYVKPNSPIKPLNSNVDGGISMLGEVNTVTGVGVGILTNNNKFTIKSPSIGGVGNISNKIGNGKILRNVTWTHDIGPEKLSFTMRREFDRQREEIELMSQLRNIIESRLKMSLPEDMASALMDGVILCHLANYVRPRSVASIHVPSPGVSKLTMARCRRNVDNFLEACRKIGVDEELICSCTDIIPIADGIEANDVNDDENSKDADNNIAQKVSADNCLNNNNNHNSTYDCVKNAEQQNVLLCAMAKLKNSKQYKSFGNLISVLKTVAALISLDSNPHHRSIKNLQQQHELQINLKKYERQHKIYSKHQVQQNLLRTTGTFKQRQNGNSSPSSIIVNSSTVSPRKCSGRIKLEGLDEEDFQLDAERKEYLLIDEEENGDDIDEGSIYDEDNIRNNAITNSEHEYLRTTATYTNEQMIKRMKNVRLRPNDNINYNSSLKENYGNRLDNLNYSNTYQRVKSNNDYDEIDGKIKIQRCSSGKTFQKIKLNLITAHGNNHYHMGITDPFTSNNLHKMVEVLPAIVEAENDNCTTPCQVLNSDGNGDSTKCIHYTHFIDEKPHKMDHNKTDMNMMINGRLSIASTNSNCTPFLSYLNIQNKYKLLELPKEKNNLIINTSATSSPSSSITKRIEFFEHANIPNGGIIQPKSNVYSIYRVNDSIEDEKLVKQLIKNKKLNATSILLRHDSQILTALLSVIFVVTFVLLVFFPLPS